MITFAVQIKGLDTGDQARWVLAVDPNPLGSRLLVVHPDKSLHWHPIGNCRFASMVDPAKPQGVVVVKPQSKGPHLALPHDGGGLLL